MRHLQPAVMVLLFACNPANPDYPPTDLPADLTACEVDTDCAGYDLGCCSACTSGLLVSMRAGLAPEDLDPYRETCRRRQVCFDLGCAYPEAICAQGTCSLEGHPGGQWSAPRLE